MAITKNDVLTAIEQIESRGDNPTNANILAIVGGSNATVQKYRSEIMSERQQQAFKSRIVLKDSELSKLTNTFNDLLANRLGELNSELTQIINQLQTSNDDLSAQLDVIQGELVNANNQSKAKDERISELENELSFIEKKASREKDELNAQLVELYKQAGKVELLTEKLASLETENRELKRVIENNKDETYAKKQSTRKQEKLPLGRE
jgi:chromosome segregation ATPase